MGATTLSKLGEQMKKYCLVLLVPLATAHADGIPDSIIGEWIFDSARTMSEHWLKIEAKQNVDPIAYQQKVDKMKERLSKVAPEVDAQASLSITSSTFTIKNDNSGTQVFSYQEIGGNSRLVVIEYSDSNGFEGIGKIRLVDGGLAFEQTDCQTYPRQCEIERKRAADRRLDQTTNTATSTTDPHANDSEDHNQSPQLVYFRPLEQKPPVAEGN